MQNHIISNDDIIKQLKTEKKHNNSYKERLPLEENN